jgi:hypothetical protein
MANINKPSKEDLIKWSNKGLPSTITHPTVTGATYPWNAPPKPTALESQTMESKKTVSMAGLKPTGLREVPGVTKPITQTVIPTTPKTNVVSPVTQDVEQKGFSYEGFKPYGYPEEGKVYTEKDLNQPMTQGGFGYVPSGLPEAGQDIMGFYAKQMEGMADRASRLAGEIEAGFYKGRRLTGAVEELKSLHTTIGTLQAGYTGMAGVPSEAGLRTAQAQEAMGKAGRERKETDVLAGTHKQAFEEKKTLAEIEAGGRAKPDVSGRNLAQKQLYDIDNDTIRTPEEKEVAKNEVYRMYPELNPSSPTKAGTKSTSKSGRKIVMTELGWEYE